MFESEILTQVNISDKVTGSGEITTVGMLLYDGIVTIFSLARLKVLLILFPTGLGFCTSKNKADDNSAGDNIPCSVLFADETC